MKSQLSLAMTKRIESLARHAITAAVRLEATRNTDASIEEIRRLRQHKQQAWWDFCDELHALIPKKGHKP